MKIEAEFEHAVGDYVCLAGTQDEYDPPKLRVIEVSFARTFDGDHFLYVLRHQGQFHAAQVIHARREEIVAYPSEVEHLRRMGERQARRKEADDAYRAYKEKRAAEKAAEAEKGEGTDRD